MIEDYHFEKILVNGSWFSSDVIICDEIVRDRWWREQAHEVCVVDIENEIDKFQPSIVVVGTGKFGRLKILPETRVFLESRGIRLIEQKTAQACKTFNELLDSERVLGAFHLTC